MLIDNASVDPSHYSFNSVQTHTSIINGKNKTTTEAVSIRNGKGMKTVIKRVGKKTMKSKKALTTQEIQNVMDRKFMPEFYVPCHEDCDRQLLTSSLRKTKGKSKKIKK